jgi:exodeoxyribonuclease-3
MKIATWNVNSVKARWERLEAFLQRHAPDVVCLQELKLETSSFQAERLRELGYHSAVIGQKTYNGVAILAREEPQAVRIGLDDGVDDEQARLIGAVIGGLTVYSIYVPNGSEPESPKFAYKLQWLQRFGAYLQRHHTPDEAVVVCGDLNIAPADIDVARPDEWNETVLCRPEVRTAFSELIAWGLVDCVRTLRPEPGLYSWWDYRQLAFPKGNGLRIDHVLATRSVAQRATQALVDRDERKGKLPSDHAPVIVELR